MTEQGSNNQDRETFNPTSGERHPFISALRRLKKTTSVLITNNSGERSSIIALAPAMVIFIGATVVSVGVILMRTAPDEVRMMSGASALLGAGGTIYGGRILYQEIREILRFEHGPFGRLTTNKG